MAEKRLRIDLATLDGHSLDGRNSYVQAVPSAILAASLVVLAFSTLGLGLILNSTSLRLLALGKLLCKRLAQRKDSDGCRLPSGGGTIAPGAMPWKNRWIGNPALSFIGRLFFKCPARDFHCGLRGFTKEAF